MSDLDKYAVCIMAALFLIALLIIINVVGLRTGIHDRLDEIEASCTCQAEKELR